MGDREIRIVFVLAVACVWLYRFRVEMYFSVS